MNYKTITLILFIFSSFFSCQKDTSNVQYISNEIEESRNPFLYVGTLHNEALNVIRHQYFLKSTDKSINSENQTVGYRSETLDYVALNNCTVDYFVSIVQMSSSPSSNIPLLRSNAHLFIDNNLSAYYDQCNNLSCLTDIQQVLTISTLSEEASSVIVSMVNEINNSGDDLTTLLNIVTRYENYISSNYTQSEKDILLLGCAVYRSSISYWYNVYVNGGTSWTDGILPRSGVSDAKDIASADLGGAIVGAGVGVYTGVTSGALVFGPGGVVTTAVGGAVLGGARASAAAGLGKLIRSWW